MNRNKFRFLKVVAFASVLLFSISAHALPPLPPQVELPPQSVFDLQKQIDQEVIERITADEDLQLKPGPCCGFYWHSVLLPSETIPAGDSYEIERLLCPDRKTQIAVLGGYQWGPSITPTKPATVQFADVVNPPCGGAFMVQLAHEASAFERNELYLWVVCVDWPFSVNNNCDEE